jgi:hypothetical protein
MIMKPKIWQAFMWLWIYSPQPTAVWKRDRHGKYLKVYDPHTRKVHRFESEQAALIWFERRSSANPKAKIE